jgi:TolB-like protein/DNA-binding SARP family transcriptional activator/Flp pilus assembly protein TadD
MVLLRLLGGLSLCSHGIALTGPATQRHRLALLALLASSGARPQSRDKLVAWLWPERDVEHARNLLNQGVHAVRRAIGEAAIVSTHDELRLDTAAVACDAVAFEEAVAAGEFERAIGLYAGPFLDGFHLPGASEFEHWADGERERLRRSYARCLQSLAEVAEARGDWSGAVERWRSLATEEPYNAGVTLRLMRALDGAGDRAGALHQARVHTLLLQQEFEAEPDPDIVALAELLRTETANGDGRKLAVRLQDAVPAPPPEPVLLSRHPGPLPESPRRRWVVPGTIGLLVLGAVGLLGGIVRGVGSPDLPAQSTAIAVLPFANMSPDGANEYFSDGMTEEIITALSKIEGLQVAARTSSFAFRGKRESVSEIGRQLGVGTVLEGSVRRSGDRLRVTAQLINVKDGYHLWAGAYDRNLRDVFAVQEEIAEAIAGVLRVRLRGEAATIVARRTMDLTAYDLYLKGRHALNQRYGASLLQAVDHFEQAVVRDPRFAQAYAGLADAYVLLPGYSVVSSSEAWPKGRAAAERALALDSTLAEAHTTLAYGKFLFESDWRAAEQGFRRAIALNPGYATAHHWYGDYLGGRGNLEGYLQELRRAQALDPLSRQIATEVGRALYALGRNDEAVTQLQQVLRADPEFAGAHVNLGRVYIQQARVPEAIGELQVAVELGGRYPLHVAELAYAYAVAGKQGEARRLLVELEGRSRREYVSPVVFAIVYMGLGQTEPAFDWLDLAVAEHDGWLAESIFYPIFDPLRSHPRYPRLLQALGLR